MTAGPEPATGNKSREGRSLEVLAQMDVPGARILVADLYHSKSEINSFYRDDLYWVDLCLTPRRPNAKACFVSDWSRNRTVELGSLIAFPPRRRLELSSSGGRHVSLICQIDSKMVESWLPADFTWTDRRLEATLDIAGDAIRHLMLRLNHELRRPDTGSETMCETAVTQLAIELARYLTHANAADERGGLAAWRLRVVNERISDPTKLYPTVAELAALCRLSTRQFSRAFKTSKGSSVSEHLAQRRIEKAKRRLYGNETLAEIAAVLGFASQSTFTTAFRRAVGITPDQFRRQTGAGRPAGKRPDNIG